MEITGILRGSSEAWNQKFKLIGVSLTRPAGEVEQIVAERVRAFLASDTEIRDSIEAHLPNSVDPSQLIEHATGLATAWNDLSTAEQRGVLLTLIARIDLGADRIDIHLVPSRLQDLRQRDRFDLSATIQAVEDCDRLTLTVRVRLRHARHGTKMILAGARSGEPDASLIKLLIKAHEFRAKLFNGDGASVSEIAKREGVAGSYVTRLFRLAFLAPDIVAAILDGRHPPTVNAAKLLKDTRLPLDWDEQRAALGFARP